MKVVVDTNVLISAFLTAGSSQEVLQEVFRRSQCILSDFIFWEFRKILLSAKFAFPPPLVEAFIEYLQDYSTVAREDSHFSGIIPDPDDQKILSLCHTVKADFLITGDAALLALQKTGVTRIITPAHFWKVIE